MKNIALLVYDVTLTGGAERVALNLAGELANHHTHEYKVFIISVAMSGELGRDGTGNNSDCYPDGVEFLSI
ncbi:MAG: hypothetical protein II915_07865, partial [Eubacterium sp.]|nr:hypothetical protein [Eubacterium sp.]